MNGTKREYCRLCFKVIAPHDPDRDNGGEYHKSCMARELRHRTRVMYLMSVLLLIFVACASAPVAKTKHYLRGCTAALTTAGSVLYERVVVVGITPQGSTYWVFYPDRKTDLPEGRKAYAEALPVERFIEIGKNGHAGNRPCRCPEALWSPTGVTAAE